MSAASARMLELVTGSERLEVFCKHEAGALTGEKGLPPGTILSVDGKPPKGAAASSDVRIACPTFRATAEMAGLSRIMGGYHIAADNVEGLAMGVKVAEHTWPKYQAYFDGTAK